MIEFKDFPNHSLFGGFTAEDVERARPLIMLKSYEKGDFIIHEKEPNNALFFLMQGRVRVFKYGIELVDFGEGESFGEIEMLDTLPAAASIQALSPVVAASISRHALHDLFKLDAKLFSIFMMNLARDLARRLRRMDERLCRLPRQETPEPQPAEQAAAR